jgi:hypothetical protein
MGKKLFSEPPDRLWDPTYLLFNRYRDIFQA